jgi:hypothetical protein
MNTYYRPIGSLARGSKTTASQRLMGVIRSFLALIFIIVSPSAAWAAGGVSLEWDPNIEPEVSGYKLHYGTASGTYSRSIDAGNATTATVEDLVIGQTYYFVVTAYDQTGNESLPSNEVTFVVPLPTTLKFTSLEPEAAPDPNGPAISCALQSGNTAGGFSLLATSAAGTVVSLFTSEDLTTWTLQGSMENPTGRMLIKDLDSFGRPKRFYRLALATPP